MSKRKRRGKVGADGLFRWETLDGSGAVVRIGACFWVRVKVDGRDRSRSTRQTDRREARRAAAQIRAELTAGSAGARRRGGLTMATLSRWHQAELVRLERSRGHREGVRYLWDRVLERLGHLDPLQLRYPQLVAYVEARRLQVSGQTIRKELQALKRGLREARRRGWPIPALEWPTVASSPRNVEQAGRLHPIPVLRAWLTDLRATGRGRRASPLAAIQAEVVLRTGLRATEVRKLRYHWLEVAPDDAPCPAYLRVPADAAKDREARVLAVGWDVVDLLDEARGLRPEGEPLVPGTHQKARDNAAKRIGHAHNITLRDLRHCFATYSTMALDLVATQAAMGHASLSTTSRYLHGEGDRTAAGTQKVAALLAGDEPTAPAPDGSGGKPSGGSPSTSEGTRPDDDPTPDATNLPKQALRSADATGSGTGGWGRGRKTRASDFLLPKHDGVTLARSRARRDPYRTSGPPVCALMSKIDARSAARLAIGPRAAKGTSGVYASVRSGTSEPNL